jgi:opacity protein-like surface antigen
MRTLKTALAVGAASFMATSALAADLPMPPPYMPPPIMDFGGWYLRGDIGFSNQHVKDIHYGRESAYTPLTSFNQDSSFNSAGIFGLGVGYQFNNWFRADLIGQYRGNSHFTAVDRFTGSASGSPYSGQDNYTGSKSEWLVMVNGYVDFGTWWGVTPFIGAGIGTAQVKISGFTDTGVNTIPFSTTSYASAPSDSRWNFAWAAHAGLAYRVNPALTLELAYTYLDMGDGQTGVLTAYNGATTGNVFKFKDITSHDVKFGMRWAIDPMPVYAPPPPLITKG